MTIKKFIPHLAIDTDFFHSAFVNSCTIYNQLAQLERCTPYCAFGHQVPNGQLLYEMVGNL
jgi:hypothetical protein